jgi:type IV pilus assembly protein PilM
MDLLPKALGTRPRLAVEIRPEGVVAARAEDAQAVVSAVAFGKLAEGAIVPGLKAGNVAAAGASRTVAVAAIRRALEAVALKERETTLVVPDVSVRVLLLDFDQLPTKAMEALPVVRFRLKKLLPFDADDAVVSYQVMSSTRGMIRVLAVAMPRDVLAEYESLVREAGFEPGAVIPSTLAACSGMPEMDAALLLVNAGETVVTTAIVQAGVLLLHRTVDLQAEGLHERVMAAAAAASHADAANLLAAHPATLPLVDPESSASEWASQEPLTGYGVVDDDRISAAAAMESERLAQEIAAQGAARRVRSRPVAADPVMAMDAAFDEQKLTAVEREVTQAVSVAAAYFEDTLQTSPGVVLAAGTMGADLLGTLLRSAGFGDGEIKVREMVEPEMLIGGALTARVPPGWLAGVRGALRS